MSIEIMLASLADNTITQYNTCLKIWWSYCTDNKIDCYSAGIPDILKCLTMMHNKGSKYGSLNSFRSAISLIVGQHVGSNELIKRFFKGVFRLRPSNPKYDITWDTNTVLTYLGGLYPNNKISLEMLSKKLVTSLALITAHRVQTLSLIKLENIICSKEKIIIKITDLIKTSRVGATQPALVIPFFLEKPEICPAQSLVDYIKMTERLRSNKSGQLFVSFKKPYGSIGSQTISRWIKDIMTKSGIDTTKFTSHSTRHASCSKAKALGLNIDVIRKTAGWGETSSVFAKFYNRPIVQHTFAETILNSSLT
jgi:hypothetical protein